MPVTPEDIQRLARHLQVPVPPGTPVTAKEASKIIRAYAKKWCDLRLRQHGYPTVNTTDLLESLYLERTRTHPDSFPYEAVLAIDGLEAVLHVNTALRNKDLSFAARLACTVAPEQDGASLLKALVTTE